MEYGNRKAQLELSFSILRHYIFLYILFKMMVSFLFKRGIEKKNLKALKKVFEAYLFSRGH